MCGSVQREKAAMNTCTKSCRKQTGTGLKDFAFLGRDDKNWPQSLVRQQAVFSIPSERLGVVHGPVKTSQQQKDRIRPLKDLRAKKVGMFVIKPLLELHTVSGERC
jgi:hypothetical protein